MIDGRRGTTFRWMVHTADSAGPHRKLDFTPGDKTSWNDARFF